MIEHCSSVVVLYSSLDINKKQKVPIKLWYIIVVVIHILCYDPKEAQYSILF